MGASTENVVRTHRSAWYHTPTMPWAYAKLKGNKVLARVNDDGAPRAEAGFVEIRYKPTDARAYRASVRNLEILGGDLLPDAHCIDGAYVERPKDGAAKTGGKTAPAQDGKSASVIHSDAVANGMDVAYTDGACSGNPGPAGCGVVLLSRDGRRTESYSFLGEATNNIAELMAIGLALGYLPEGKNNATILTDSSYSIGVLQKGWKAKANQELVAHLRSLLRARPGVTLKYVPGHAGVELNERADELARQAIRERASGKSTLPTG